MSNVVTAYMDAQAVGRNLGFYGDANAQFVRDNFPEVAELNDLKNQGVVDIFGNRRDAPGYSLSNSSDNPNPLVFSIDRESFPTSDRLPVTDVNEMREITGTPSSVDNVTQTDSQVAEQAVSDSNTLTTSGLDALYKEILGRPFTDGDAIAARYLGMSEADVRKELSSSPEALIYKQAGDDLTIDQRAAFLDMVQQGLPDIQDVNNDGVVNIDDLLIDMGRAGYGENILPRSEDPVGSNLLDPVVDVAKDLTTTDTPSAVPTPSEVPFFGSQGLERIFTDVVGRKPTTDDYNFYFNEFGGGLDPQERADLTRRLRPEQLERFDRQLGLPSTVRRDAAGNIPTVDPLNFDSFGATPATAGIRSLEPRDDAGALIGGTMASAFANPQFTSPFSIQTEQQELPKDTFTQLGDLFSEQFKEEIRGPLEEQIRAEVAEEAEGKRAGGLASLGYRRGGVVDENGIPRLFIGGLFKGIGRALKGAFKGVTKIAPFVLPFIPGFQGLALGQQALLGGVAGGFAGGDGKFDLKRALTSGLTTYGIGSLARAAGTPVGPEGGGVGGGGVGQGATYGVDVSTAPANIGQTTSNYTGIGQSTAGASTTPSGFGIDRLQAEAVGTGQRIGDTFSNIASGNVAAKDLITPTLTTVGGISATKAADEIAKQEAEYKALTAADAAEKERKRRLALEAIKRNPFGYNEGGVSSLPARYLDGAGDGMSDSIRANIGGMQEARLADGEFVVPADVVADLGNGSSNAGAERLYSMMDRIRQARHGTTKQPPEVNVNKTLPA